MERTLFLVNLGTVLASSILSAIGIYLLNSVYWALLSAVACIAARSLVASRILDRCMELPAQSSSFGAVILTVIFVVSSLMLGTLYGCGIYALVYFVYCALNWRDVSFYGKRAIRKKM